MRKTKAQRELEAANDRGDNFQRECIRLRSELGKVNREAENAASSAQQIIRQLTYDRDALKQQYERLTKLVEQREAVIGRLCIERGVVR